MANGICEHIEAIAEVVRPQHHECQECIKTGGHWVHLRTCQQCGGTRCCDSSPNQHASKHAAESGHHIIRSFEPREDWFWSFQDESFYDGPKLAPPEHHPTSQPTPGPAGRVPQNWRRQLH